MEVLLDAVALARITQEDLDAALRAVAEEDLSLFAVGEVYGARLCAGPPAYPSPHVRVYGVRIESVDAERIRFRYVVDREITRGPLRGARSDVVLDAVMEADGPCLGDWTARDEVRTCPLRGQGRCESFVDVGEEECVTFHA